MRAHFSAPEPQTPSNPNGFSCSGVPLHDLVAAAQTPLYVTSLDAITARYQAWQQTLAKHFPNSAIRYAVKANPARPLLRHLSGLGCGADLVSQGEMRRAFEEGFSPEKMCLAGVGKRPSEIKEALGFGIGVLNAEHLHELQIALDLLFEKKGPTKVALRLNPSVELDTHPHLKTGSLDSKFGILFEHLAPWLASQKARLGDPEKWAEWLAPLQGIHVHIGSQMHSSSVFLQVAQRLAATAKLLEGFGAKPQLFDLGGGLGVGELGIPSDHSDIAPHVETLAHALKTALAQENTLIQPTSPQFEVLMEPGRSLVASSTAFLTEVLYIKDNSPEHIFAIVDGGMNDFPRPALYGARHPCTCVAQASPASPGAKARRLYTVAGPVCESGDILARHVDLPTLSPGDTLAFWEAGAYCASMASHYNMRPLPAQIFCLKGSIHSVLPAQEPKG